MKDARIEISLTIAESSGRFRRIDASDGGTPYRLACVRCGASYRWNSRLRRIHHEYSSACAKSRRDEFVTEAR